MTRLDFTAGWAVANLGHNNAHGIYSNVMEITPPLIMTTDEVEEGIAILGRAIGEVEEGQVSDDALGEYAGW